MCETKLPEELNTFYACFDLLSQLLSLFGFQKTLSVSVHSRCKKNPDESERQ